MVHFSNDAVAAGQMKHVPVSVGGCSTPHLRGRISSSQSAAGEKRARLKQRSPGHFADAFQNITSAEIAIASHSQYQIGHSRTSASAVARHSDPQPPGARSTSRLPELKPHGLLDLLIGDYFYEGVDTETAAWGLRTGEDQQLAGVLMILSGLPVYPGAALAIFGFRLTRMGAAADRFRSGRARQ